jgi:4'-phosphopantetheinyl transferase
MVARDEVLVWVRPTGEVDAHAAERALVSAELRRAARFADVSTRSEWVASRAVLRELLGGLLHVEPREVALTADSRGKPMLADAPRLGFSLSRCSGAVAVAVAPGRRVGVDIERVRRVEPAERIGARYFAPADEARMLAARPGLERERAFAGGWVAMEAMTKAWGVGVPAAARYRAAAADGAARTLTWNGRQWSAAELEGPPGCALAVAAEGAGWRPRLLA